MKVYIVDNKKLLMSEEEFACFSDICKSYDRNNFKGVDLFKGLFETDDHGLITFIKPSNGRQISMEIYLFICTLFQTQQMRLLKQQVDEFLKETEKRVDRALSSVVKK